MVLTQIPSPKGVNAKSLEYMISENTKLTNQGAVAAFGFTIQFSHVNPINENEY